VAAIVRAYRIAREATGADAAWDAVERLHGVDRAVQAELMNGVDAFVEATTRWYLAWPPEGSLEEAVTAGHEAFRELGRVLAATGDEERRRRRDEEATRLIEAGVPEKLARAHALRPELVHAPDVARVARRTERSIEDVTRVFFAVGERLRLDWLEHEIDRVRSATRMQRWALQAVRDDVLYVRRELAEEALLEAPGADPQDAVQRFLDGREQTARRLETFMRTLAREGDPDLAGLSLAVRQLRGL
jgi:glutamate dehydrogenase